MPLSTAHRLLAELEAWDALQRDAHGRYQVGLRLWELGQHAERQVRDTARPLLQDLYTLTQETVHIAVREHTEALYIDRVYGSRRVPQASRVGGRLPLHATAVGKVLLAFEETSLREALLAEPLERRTDSTHVDVTALRSELEVVRERGFALTLNEVRRGSASIAVPIFQRAVRDADATRPSRRRSVSSPTPSSPAPSSGIWSALRGIARRIETSVGGFGPRAIRRPASEEVASTGRKSPVRSADRTVE
jgi:DNA-binding IclR family transcriptional regulator